MTMGSAENEFGEEASPFNPSCDPVDGPEPGGVLFDSVDDPEFTGVARSTTTGPWFLRFCASATCLSRLQLHPPHRRALQVPLVLQQEPRAWN